MRGAHPRACGENGRPVPPCPVLPGSSPRVRGKRWHRACNHSSLNLIPARAGKTTPSPPATCAVTAHPRACGENWTRASIIHPPKGSSPRVRGKPGRACPPGEGPGLIPACAGKTRCRRPTGEEVTAHPRACGENLDRCGEHGPDDGSSPRVRGKRLFVPCSPLPHRLIPARAGKTRAVRRGCRRRPAHPRVCGENLSSEYTETDWAGSSPRVRGKRAPESAPRPSLGLIPARAGKTPRPGQRARRGAAHPRACGENKRVNAIQSCSTGSSPRVRGKLPVSGARGRARGLIPARAGKTRGLSTYGLGVEAHPRACGENCRVGYPRASIAGSSPRVRGKRAEVMAGAYVPGLIPARAGKTTTTAGPSSAVTAHPRVCGENAPPRPKSQLLEGSSPRVRGKRDFACVPYG